MDEIKKALKKSGDEVSEKIRSLRAEMLAIAEEQTQAIGQCQEGLERCQEGLERCQEGLERCQHELEGCQQGLEHHQRTLGRQTHIIDQGLARVDETFQQHKQNISPVIFSFVEDVNILKADVRSAKSRLDALEGGSPAA